MKRRLTRLARGAGGAKPARRTHPGYGDRVRSLLALALLAAVVPTAPAWGANVSKGVARVLAVVATRAWERES